MFWRNLIAALLFFSIFNSSCRNNKPAEPVAALDTSRIRSWKNSFDSLYDKFDATHDPRFLKQAGPLADSILFYEPLLLKDTALRKIFLGTLFDRSIHLNILRIFIKSRELLEEYIMKYKEYGLDKPGVLANARLTLGNIYSRYGDYKKAFQFLQQSLKYYTDTKYADAVASSILNMSITLKELRRYEEAEQTLQQIFPLFPSDHKRKAKASIELADIYIRQYKLPDAESAIKKAKGSLALMPHGADRTETYSLLYSVEGNQLTAANKPLLALSSYQRSLDSAKIISAGDLRNRDIGKTYVSMGKALEQMHLYDSALHFYNRALYTVVNIDTSDRFSLPEQKDLYAENTIAEALYARAGCMIARGTESEAELENAISCYKLAFETERKLLDAFSYDESRQQMVEQARKQSEKAIAVCYRLYQRTKDDKWANEAFLFAEHNKAFILTESVRRNTAASLYLENDPLYEKLQQLRTEMSMIETELGRQNSTDNTDTVLTRQLSVSKEKAELSLLEAENNMRIKNPAYTTWLATGSHLTAKELIDKTVSTGNRFIEYFTGDSAIYVFNGEKNKPVGFNKLPGSIKNSADSFLHYFSGRNFILNDPAGYAATANRLYISLLPSYEPSGRSSLLIIPDGFISLIPFDALLTGPAASANISSFPFLIKQQEVHYAFSCRTLIEQANDRKKSTGNSVAVFAPVFAGRERGLAPLMNSSSELEAVKQLYPGGKFFSAGNATLKQFETNCSNSLIIHLATHAGAANGMGMPGIEFYDSTLSLNRIYTMPINAKLVVLSGCETGAGAINKTEGLMSLARGFSYAGTKNVIGSLWPTDDRTSADVFKNFYGSLDNSNFSTALHKAKLSIINNSSTASASPYFWSGYIYIGSPEENIKSNSPGWLKPGLLIGGLLLIMAYFFFRRRTS